jgi:hypothetical protein
MKKNMGSIDQIVRIIIAAVIAVLFFTGVIPVVLGIILIVVAGIFLITGFARTCPLYIPFGINTCAKKDK